MAELESSYSRICIQLLANKGFLGIASQNLFLTYNRRITWCQLYSYDHTTVIVLSVFTWLHAVSLLIRYGSIC